MSAGVILGTVGVVLAVIGLGVIIDRRWSILPRPGELAQIDPAAPPPEPPGMSASAPLRLTPKKLTGALDAQRCTACKKRLVAGPGEPIRYAERELQLFPLTCPACGARRGLYVHVVAA